MQSAFPFNNFCCQKHNFADSTLEKCFEKSSQQNQFYLYSNFLAVLHLCILKFFWQKNYVKHSKIEFFDNSDIVHYYSIGFEKEKGKIKFEIQET